MGSSRREGPHGATREDEEAIAATASLLSDKSLDVACFGAPGDRHVGFVSTQTRPAPAVAASRRADRAESEESHGLSVLPCCSLAERRSLASCIEGEAGGEFRFALLVMGALPPPLIRPLHCEDCSQVVALQLAAIFRLQEALQGRSRA